MREVGSNYRCVKVSAGTRQVFQGQRRGQEVG